MKILIVCNSENVKYDKLEKYGSVQYALPHELNLKKDFLDDVDALIFTGGPQHLTEIEKYPELRDELALLKCAIDKRIIIIGICLGFQLINYHFGNKVIQLPEPVLGHNYMEQSSLLGEAFSFHYDGVPENNAKELETIAYSVPIYGHKYIYCVKHRELPIYGIQSHPDASNKSIEHCLRMYNLGDIELHSDTKYEAIFDTFFQLGLSQWTAEKFD